MTVFDELGNDDDALAVAAFVAAHVHSRGQIHGAAGPLMDRFIELWWSALATQHQFLHDRMILLAIYFVEASKVKAVSLPGDDLRAFYAAIQKIRPWSFPLPNYLTWTGTMQQVADAMIVQRSGQWKREVV